VLTVPRYQAEPPLVGGAPPNVSRAIGRVLSTYGLNLNEFTENDDSSDCSMMLSPKLPGGFGFLKLRELLYPEKHGLARKIHLKY
jgi:hypothetical protein